MFFYMVHLEIIKCLLVMKQSKQKLQETWNKSNQTKKMNFEIENMRKCPNELSNEAATR